MAPTEGSLAQGHSRESLDAAPAIAEKIQQDQLSSVATSFLRLRPRVVGVAGPWLMLVLLNAQLPPLQLWCVVANFLTMLSFFVWEAWRMRTRPATEGSFARSLMLTAVGLCLVTGLSGGMSSPFLPILFAPLGIAFAAFGRGRATRRVVALLAAGLCASMILDQLLPWPPIATPHAVPLLAAATLVSATLLFFGITSLTAAYRGTARKLESMRLELLAESTQRSQSLGRVGDRVAHELKNPLASIKGLIQLQLEGLRAAPDAKPGSRDARRLDVVLDEVSRMEDILNEYLSFSRPLSPLSEQQHSVDEFISDLGALLEGQARQQGVALQVESQAGLATFDRPRLKQALLNLAQNALAATAPGGTLRLGASAVEGGLRITLEDTGRGMTEEQLRRVKEPYFTATSSGTGLGVVIANGIIEQHGGYLGYKSKQGVGTTATVTLPRRRAAGSRPEPSPTVDPQPGKPTEPWKAQ